MSAPFVIIDGYNLLHAAGLARLQYGPGDLDRARNRLLALLAEKLRPDERRRCTVVFDALNAPADSRRQFEHHEMTVLYAPPGQDADTVIEQMIASHPASRRTIVISSDHRLHQAAKRRNATPMDSEAFLSELDRRESISPHKDGADAHSPAPPKPKSTPRGQTDDWQNIFGEIDVQTLAEEVGREQLAASESPDVETSRLNALQRQLDDPESLEKWLNDAR